jgi:hypothetical protein
MNGFMKFEDVEQALKWAKIISDSGCISKEFHGKPSDVLVAIEYGMELGLKPMQSLQSVMIVNGKPTLYGDSLLALCIQHPGFKDCVESYDSASQVATCVVKRKHREPVTATFGIENAKLAGLWGKPGPWKTYPERMLKFKARAYALRDMFPDVLKGLSLYEDVVEALTDNSISSNSYNNPQSKNTVTNIKDKFIKDSIFVTGDNLEILSRFIFDNTQLNEIISEFLVEKKLMNIKEIFSEDAEKLINLLVEEYPIAKDIYDKFYEEKTCFGDLE